MLPIKLFIFRWIRRINDVWMCCTQQAIHGLNYGEREGSPGSFPLRLDFDDPCEQLGGIWWGSTHHAIEIYDETCPHTNYAIEVFQVCTFTIFLVHHCFAATARIPSCQCGLYYPASASLTKLWLL